MAKKAKTVKSKKAEPTIEDAIEILRAYVGDVIADAISEMVTEIANNGMVPTGDDEDEQENDDNNDNDDENDNNDDEDEDQKENNDNNDNDDEDEQENDSGIDDEELFSNDDEDEKPKKKGKGKAKPAGKKGRKAADDADDGEEEVTPKKGKAKGKASMSFAALMKDDEFDEYLEGYEDYNAKATKDFIKEYSYTPKAKDLDTLKKIGAAIEMAEAKLSEMKVKQLDALAESLGHEIEYGRARTEASKVKAATLQLLPVLAEQYEAKKK